MSINNSDKDIYLKLATDETFNLEAFNMLKILLSYDREQWDDRRIKRAIENYDKTDPTESILISLDYVMEWNHPERDENDITCTVSNLKETIDNLWGETFNTYNVIGTGAGDHFDGVNKKAKNASIANGKPSMFDFNGVTCIVNAETNLELLYRDYCTALNLKWKEIGPICVENYDETVTEALHQYKIEAEERSKRWAEENAREEAEKKNQILPLIEGIEMELTDATIWNEYVTKNTDMYGTRTVSYANEWARLMQVQLDQVMKGFEWSDAAFIHAFAIIAERTSRIADYDGITGFMYGCSVRMLTQCWKYGEYLRKWHNKEYNHEGAGVVNPAMLSISEA